jgi:hypothetical protein
MNAVQKAIDDVKFTIPVQILEACFAQTRFAYRGLPVSIDEEIRRQVVRPRVLVDCNILGGTEAVIDLSGLRRERINDYLSVFHVPKERTQQRSIISVLNVTFSDPAFTGANGGLAQGCQATSLMLAGQGMVDAQSPIPITSTARAELIGENVVRVQDTIVLPSTIYLRCFVANEENMGNIPMRAYLKFGKLVQLAVKSYIYNTMVVRMDMGELHGGQALGRFKDIIETYADAEELYSTYLVEKWQKVAYMSDSTQMNRHISLIVGGRP